MLRNKCSAILIIIFQFCFLQDTNAFTFSKETCLEYGLGRSWYCESEQEEQTSPYTTAPEIMQRQIEPEQKAVLLNQLWEVQQKRAVITGNKSDLENVLITQNYIAQLGTDFARNMIRLINSNPNYASQDSYYQNVSNEMIENADIERTFQEEAGRYAIAFIYNSTCHYCKLQLPILEHLRIKTGLKIIGISSDGGKYQGLDEIIVDESVLSDPNVKSFPTLMLLDAKEGRRVFLAKGLITEDQLLRQIYNRIKEIKTVEMEQGTNNAND